MTIIPTANNSDPILVDAEQAARLCGCSARHFKRLSESGRAPRGVKLGQLTRYRATEIKEWIATGCKPPSQSENANASA